MERTNAEWLELLEQHKTHIKYLQTDYDLEETFESDFKSVIKDSEDKSSNLDDDGSTFIILIILVSLLIHGNYSLLLFLFLGYWFLRTGSKIINYYENKPIKEKQSYLKARLLKVIEHYENNRQEAFDVQKGRLEDAHNKKMEDNLKRCEDEIARSKSLMNSPFSTFEEEFEQQEEIREDYIETKYRLIYKFEDDVEHLQGYYGILD